MVFSDKDQESLRQIVNNNRKKRLKIKPHDNDEIKNDEFVIQKKDELI